MKYQVFTVYDSKIKTYLRPFYDLHVGGAVRGFQDIVNDETSVIGQHPEDFTLFHIGEFDNESCEFEMFKTPTSLGVGIHFKEGYEDAETSRSEVQ